MINFRIRFLTYYLVALSILPTIFCQFGVYTYLSTEDTAHFAFFFKFYKNMKQNPESTKDISQYLNQFLGIGTFDTFILLSLYLDKGCPTYVNENFNKWAQPPHGDCDPRDIHLSIDIMAEGIDSLNPNVWKKFWKDRFADCEDYDIDMMKSIIERHKRKDLLDLLPSAPRSFHYTMLQKDKLDLYDWMEKYCYNTEYNDKISKNLLRLLKLRVDIRLSVLKFFERNCNNVKMLEDLIDYGGEVNARNDFGEFPLMLALARDYPDDIKYSRLLLRRGAFARSVIYHKKGEFITSRHILHIPFQRKDKEPFNRRLELAALLIAHGAKQRVISYEAKLDGDGKVTDAVRVELSVWSSVASSDFARLLGSCAMMPDPLGLRQFASAGRSFQISVSTFKIMIQYLQHAYYPSALIKEIIAVNAIYEYFVVASTEYYDYSILDLAWYFAKDNVRILQVQEKVKYLIEEGEDVDVRCKRSGLTSLQIVVMEIREDHISAEMMRFVSALLDFGANTNLPISDDQTIAEKLLELELKYSRI